MTDVCEACGDPTDDTGCYHDGHTLCASCLDHCGQCAAAIREDWSLT